MWFLRGWKIQQIEQITAEKGKRSKNIDKFVESLHDQEVSPMKKRVASNLLQGFFVWEKV